VLGQSLARDLNEQLPGQSERQAIAASTLKPITSGSHQETSDAYSGVVTCLCDHHRVIVCRDRIQWIVQRRKNGGAERPWRGVGYFRTRDALIRACATLCGQIDPVALAILADLPVIIGGAT
jgi:hypothetical protein